MFRSKKFLIDIENVDNSFLKDNIYNNVLKNFVFMNNKIESPKSAYNESNESYINYKNNSIIQPDKKEDGNFFENLDNTPYSFPTTYFFPENKTTDEININCEIDSMNFMKQPDEKKYMLIYGNQYFLEKLDDTSNDSQTTYFFPENKTTYQSLQPIEHYPRQKLPIFDIQKITKLRKKRNGNKHTKYSDDLIIMKVKGSSSDKYRKHLNFMLKNSKNDQINYIQLKKVEPSIIKVHSKKDNIELLNKEMSDIFSGKISRKYKYTDQLYNKKKIKIILEKGDEEIKNALKKTFRDSLELYCSKRTDIYLFEKSEKLEDDVEEFKSKGEDEEYIKMYIHVAKNFEKIIKSIDQRQPRKKK